MNDFDKWDDVARVTGRVSIANLVFQLDRAYETLGQDEYTELLRDLDALIAKAKTLTDERSAQIGSLA